MTDRKIASFGQDDDGDWVARLDCGHPQHVRHRPPWELRPWVLSTEGRDAMLGTELDCQYCDMPSLPPDVRAYRRTRLFDEVSIPDGLLASHHTKPGVWGRIIVADGRLGYIIADHRREWILRPGIDGIIAPESDHQVKVVGPVQFCVEFLRPGG